MTYNHKKKLRNDLGACFGGFLAYFLDTDNI